LDVQSDVLAVGIGQDVIASMEDLAGDGGFELVERVKDASAFVMGVRVDRAEKKREA